MSSIRFPTVACGALILGVSSGLAGLGCGPKAPPPAAPPAAEAPLTETSKADEPSALAPAPSVPQSPLQHTGHAIANAPELPLLSGATRDLNLVTLTSTTQTFTIEADTQMFTATDPRVGQRLRLAFEFDPRWRVGLWEGQPVAWARQADSAGWSAPWGGYRQADALTIRSMFRFAPRPSDHPWSASGLVARNEAGTRAMQVMAWKVDRGAWLNQHAAAFTIDGNGLSLEVHEISSNLTLTGTQSALRQASLRTKAIADQVERDHLQRTGLAMVPSGEPRIGNPFVEVRTIDGTLDLRGRVNAGAPGWIWMRMLDESGQAWNETTVAVATAERVGWDTNPSVVSYFQSVIPVATGAPTTGTVEVWFQPDGSDDVKSLGRFPFPGP